MVEPLTRPDAWSPSKDFTSGRKKKKPKNYKIPPVEVTQNREGLIRVIQVRPTDDFNQVTGCLTCPQCFVKISSKAGRLEKNIRKVHGSTVVASPLREGDARLETSAVRRPTPLYPCHACGAQVKSLQKHAKRTGHGLKPNMPKLTPQRSRGLVLKSSPTEVKCAICSANFPNATQLASHVIGSHGKKAFHAQGNEKSNNRQDSQDIYSQRSKNESTPNMDAKFCWGNSFRDNGQFGSYPSHDGMDDESSP